MRTKFATIVCAAFLGAASTTPIQAQIESSPTAVAGDAVIARPVLFAATIMGGVFFVVSLPFAATSRSIDSTADALVVRPARATFVRPLGDFSYSSTVDSGSMAATKKSGKQAKTRTAAHDLAQR